MGDFFKNAHNFQNIASMSVDKRREECYNNTKVYKIQCGSATGGREMADTKNIRIRIKSERYEVEASLFSSPETENGEMLSIFFEGAEAKPEIVEIQTEATLTLSDGRVEISYDETEATGMQGSRTVISFLEEEDGIVSMVREGMVSTNLVFEAGKRYLCVYRTPYMPFEVCVRTFKVDNRLLGERTLALDYVVEIRGAQAERTKFYVQIL